jgi:hypothetical protein
LHWFFFSVCVLVWGGGGVRSIIVFCKIPIFHGGVRPGLDAV